MGYTDDTCSVKSEEAPAVEEEKRQVAKPYRPQFKLKSQNSQKTFSSQNSVSQKSSDGGDLSKNVAVERQEERVKDFVHSKKRTWDMITREED